jgi:YhcN/YlaJ family sporulation lipoprotein
MKRSTCTVLILLLLFAVSACNPAQQGQPGTYQDDPGGFTEPFATDFDRDVDENIYSFDQAVPYGNRPMRQGIRDTGRNRITAQDTQQGRMRMQRTPEMAEDNQTAQEVAERLAQLATRVEQVNDATAVVVGRYAVVGIDVDANLDRAKVGSIKYTVAEALKDDPMGANAIVIADADTYYRLQEMAEEIRTGRPLAGVMDELAEIVGRLMPQVPRQVEQQDVDETPDHPADQEENNR